MASTYPKCGWALVLLVAAGAGVPASASAVTTCALDGGSGELTVTHSIDDVSTSILGGPSPTVPGQTLVGISPTSATCPVRTGVEVTGITYVQAGGVSDLVVVEPSALRRGPGRPIPRPRYR